MTNLNCTHGRPALIVSLAVMLSACLGGSVTLNDHTRQRLKADPRPINTLLFTAAGSSGLQLTTYESARLAGGSGRQLLAVRDGKRLTDEIILPHPMATTRDLFVAQLKSRAGLTRFKLVLEPLDTSLDTPLKLREELGHDLLLDFRGTYHLVFLPNDHNRYRLLYEGRARLMNLDNGEIYWQASCKADIEDPSAPTLEQLRDRRGAKLKGWLQRGAGLCSRQLADHFFAKKS